MYRKTDKYRARDSLVNKRSPTMRESRVRTRPPLLSMLFTVHLITD